MKYSKPCMPIPGVQSLFVFFVLLFLSFLFLAYTHRQKIPVVASLQSSSTPDLTMKRGKSVEAIDFDKVSKPSPEQMERAREVFKSQCAMCHGNEGKGDGVASKGMTFPPRNFHDSSDWTNGRSLFDVFRTLTEGIGSRGMLSYDTLPVVDRFALSHLVRSYRTDSPPVTSTELKDLAKKYGLDKTSSEPNQIPVSMAMRVLASEDEDRLGSAMRFRESVLREAEIGSSAARKLTDIFGNLNQLYLLLSRSSMWQKSPADFQYFLLINSRSLASPFHTDLLNPHEAANLYRYLSEHAIWDVKTKQKNPTLDLNQAVKARSLMDQYDCNVCHTKAGPKIGPSYRMIAKKSGNSKTELLRLIQKVRRGGSGVWGDVPMVPHMHIPESEIRLMVEYMLNPEGAEAFRRASAKPASPGEKLLSQKGCLLCHDPDQKLVGPSFRMLSGKYENKESTLQTLLKKVRLGGSGNWGQVPMIPHPGIPDGDIRTMIEFILSHKKAESPEKKSKAPEKSMIPAIDPMKLAQKNNCIACHNVDAKIIGPSFKMLAERYKFDETTLAKLVKKVTEGGSGNWGPMPMPSNAHVPIDEIKAIVSHMLTYGQE